MNRKSANDQVVPLVILIAATLFLAFSIYLHADFINGPSYWKWDWQRVDLLRFIPALALFAVPFIVGQSLYHQKKISLTGAMLWMMASIFVGQMAFSIIQSPQVGLFRIVKCIEDPLITSYFTEASRISNVGDYLRRYPDLLPSFWFHAQNKPPGLILYYWLMISWFHDPNTAALAGGLLLAFLASLTAPLTFFMVRSLFQDQEAAYCSASLMALTPSLILIFPEFDQACPIWTCLMIGLWAVILRKDRPILSVFLGLILAAGLFMSWSVLILCGVLAMMTIYSLVIAKGRTLPMVIKHTLVCVTVLAGVYVLLWALTGYNLASTLSRCISMQKQITLGIVPARPCPPQTIFFDISDFLLGAGWLPFVLSMIFLFKQVKSRAFDQAFWFTIIVFLQILLIAMFNLAPAETARVWTYLLPLLLVPAGFGLKTFTFAGRMVVSGCSILLLGAVGQNMVFLRLP